MTGFEFLTGFDYEYKYRTEPVNRKQWLLTFFFSFFFTFIEPQGASYGELNRPSPQFQADRPQSVKVYGRIEGHSNPMLILLNAIVLEVITVDEGLVTLLRLTLVKANLILMTG